MALVADGKLFSDVPDALDELAFDDERRQTVQAVASKFLQVGTAKASC
jgi:hypothetical protein